MKNYTVSLSDTLSDFLKQVVADGGYTNENEYITEVLENRKKNYSLKHNKLLDLQKLYLFNRKAETLEKYKLWEHLKNDQPVFQFSVGKTSNNFPDDEMIEAPLITLRLFMQDNDHISIRNISKIYSDNSRIPSDLKDSFVEHRNNLNSFLDKESLFSIQSIIWISERERLTTKYTNREILNSLLYGEIAHFTRMEDYQSIYGNLFTEGVNLMQFMGVAD